MDEFSSRRANERPLKKSHGEGSDKQTDRQTDIATTRKNQPKGQFFEKKKTFSFKWLLLNTICSIALLEVLR